MIPEYDKNFSSAASSSSPTQILRREEKEVEEPKQDLIRPVQLKIEKKFCIDRDMEELKTGLLHMTNKLHGESETIAVVTSPHYLPRYLKNDLAITILKNSNSSLPQEWHLQHEGFDFHCKQNPFHPLWNMPFTILL